jgi:hypothetical protein
MMATQADSSLPARTQGGRLVRDLAAVDDDDDHGTMLVLMRMLTIMMATFTMTVITARRSSST